MSVEYTVAEQQANRNALVQALRSGEYEQCKGHLREDDTYCCLGVACDLYSVEHEEQWEPMESPGLYTFIKDDAILPMAVRKWLGFEAPGAALKDGLSLASKNDDGATFEEIADLIEGNKVILEKLPTITIDRSKWRTGASGDNQTGLGATRLENLEGYMCCLGFTCKQFGYKDLIGKLLPGCLRTIIPTLTTVVQDGIIDTIFAEKASEINDDSSITPRRREFRLKRLFKENGLELKFVGSYPEK